MTFISSNIPKFSPRVLWYYYRLSITPSLKMYSKFVLPNCTVFSHVLTMGRTMTSCDRPLLWALLWWVICQTNLDGSSTGCLTFEKMPLPLECLSLENRLVVQPHMQLTPTQQLWKWFQAVCFIRVIWSLLVDTTVDAWIGNSLYPLCSVFVSCSYPSTK